MPLEQVNVEWMITYKKLSLHVSLNVIMCPRIYAKITAIFYIIFCITCYVNMSLIDNLVRAVMQTSMWPYCVLTDYPLIFRCKDTLDTCPASWFVARCFKDQYHQYHMALVKNRDAINSIWYFHLNSKILNSNHRFIYYFQIHLQNFHAL